MTLPAERTRAVLAAGKFLEDLLDMEKTPKVPADIRQRACRVLRHFPIWLDFAIGPVQFDWKTYKGLVRDPDAQARPVEYRGRK